MSIARTRPRDADHTPMPPPSRPPRAPRTASDGPVLLGLGLAFAALLGLTLPWGDMPLNDDWVYALAVKSVLETGRFALPSPSSANALTHVYWGALFCLPFGFSFDALRLSGAVTGLVGVLALYALLREVGAQQRVAAIGAALLAANPVCLQLSATFMTDVPFTTLLTLTLLLYCRGVRRASAWLLAAAFVLTAAAILLRQFALVLPLGFGAALLARRGFAPRTLLLAALPVVLGLAIHVAYQRWLIGTGRTPVMPVTLADLVPHDLRGFVEGAARTSLRCLVTLGLFMAPLIVAVRALPGRRWPGAAALIAIAIAALLLAFHAPMPLLPNILLPTGLGPLTLHDIFHLLQNVPQPSPTMAALWLLATGVGVAAGAVLLAAIARTLIRLLAAAWRPSTRERLWRQYLMLAVAVPYFAGTLLLGSQSVLFERYLLPLLPPLLAILVMDQSAPAPSLGRHRSTLAAGLLAAGALFSVAATHDYLAWNRARWRATAALLAQGVPQARIDGGYEFDGWFRYDPHYRPLPGKDAWWVTNDDYMIAGGPLPDYRVIGSCAAHPWLATAPNAVWILRRLDPEESSGPASITCDPAR